MNELQKGPELNPKQFETKTNSLQSKFQGKVKVKEESGKYEIKGDKVLLKKGEYVKLMGITSVERTPLFHDKDKYFYLLELSNNLDFIATGILGGELDKMLLIPEEKNPDDGNEKCQFYEKDGIIYLVYGMFPDKKGKWLLEQMEKYYSELVKDKDVNNLSKIERHQINNKFKPVRKFLLDEYFKLQDVFSEQDIPYVDPNLKIHYLGLSSKSIGVISLLLGDDLNIDLPVEYDDPEELKEMKENMITARIEAIAANTLGNTQAVPRWIAVKLGFQNYRFLTFKKLENDYFFYMLAEGNLGKLDLVEEILLPPIKERINSPFSGNLRPFNQVKFKLKNMLNEKRSFS